jgi:RNA-binding protein 26
MAPLFTETDAPLLKTYIITRLESASEADPDVLSDYILALLRHDKPPAEVMSTCITQLADFMTSGETPFSNCLPVYLMVDPTSFVKDIFEAIAVFKEDKERS